ncbi:DUF6778 family protein [Halovulum sp. GXIMD14793]
MKTLSFVAAAMLVALSACSSNTAKPDNQTFRSPISVSAQQVASWRVRDVRVVIPEGMAVSKNPNVSKPSEPITWWEDPAGDRKAQVAAIMKRATQQGSSFLRGGTPVVLEVHVARFHALTPKARSRQLAGWHDVQFSIFVRDAGGNTLAQSGVIDAGLVAYQGDAARQAVARGQTQKARISQRVASVVSAWLNSNGSIKAAPRRAAAPKRARTTRTPPKPAPATPAPQPPKPIGVEDVGPDSSSVARNSGRISVATAGRDCVRPRSAGAPANTDC